MPIGWMVFFGLLMLYLLFLFWVVRSGRMEQWNLSLMLGIVLMVRTQRGKRIIERISRPKRAWNIFGDVGTVVTVTGMVFFTAITLMSIPFALQPRPGQVSLGPQHLLVIPGVNPLVPLWYGLIALIVALVVHEGGHGVLARANNLRIKSLGLLFAIVPIGAFVEPDEDEMKAATRRKRLRVVSAGAMVNIVVALAVGAAFAGMVAAADPIDGVAVRTVTAGQPAEIEGIRPGDVLVSADGEPLADWMAFRAFMEGRLPGDTAVFGLRGGGEAAVELTSRWQALDDESRRAILDEEPEAMEWCSWHLGREVHSGGECSNALDREAFLGIGVFDSHGYQELLVRPLSSLTGVQMYLTLPLFEVFGGTPILGSLPLFFETPWDGTWAEGAYFPILMVLFWVFWINLMLGLTNILPLMPLDGGHLFRDVAGGVMGRLRPRMDPEARERLVGRATVAVSLLLLVAILLLFFGQRIVGAFSG